MSNKLKRKLGDLGVDPSSSRANESFCLIGTPLPPLEKSKDTGEFVPLWKQDVRDEKGRRRLHGAFTGGFSAGYFNTVGSKEGWTPQTFVSSRADRAKTKAARPEDFMDEEDLAELRESQSLVDTNEGSDLFGTAKQGAEPETDSITRALESSLLPPVADSVGARILKKMGWRLGQGIGPRITYRQRLAQEGEVEGEGEEDEEAKKHMYARRDMKVLSVERKDNSWGVGYVPGMGLTESLGGKNGASAGGGGPKLAAGFGLGALNDAEDDDVDVYDGDIRKHDNTRRMAYDVSEADDGDGERIVIGGKGGHKSKAGMRPPPPPTNTDTSTKLHDGRSVLAGFILSSKPVAEDRWFPLPDIPKGWTPNPKRVWEKFRNGDGGDAKKENEPPPHQLSHERWKTGISADERGTILGETPLPAAPRSVFEYMSQKDRERLKNISASAPTSTSTPTSTSAPEPASSSPSAPASITIPRTDSQIAQLALKGFQPFSNDPAKHARYTAYLYSQIHSASSTAPPPPGPEPGQSVEEFNKEMDGYAKAATIFKPLGGAMAGRFTSAILVDPRLGSGGTKDEGGLHVPSAEDYTKSKKREEESKKGPGGEMEKREDESPKEHAARMGMYGMLTREVKVWIPAKLLCKRFGVKDPNPAPVEPEPGPPTQMPGFGQSQASATSFEEEPAAPAASTTSTGTSRRNGPRDLANIGLGEDDDQGRDILTYSKPAMDIFKAIFASDDESGDEEEGGAEDSALDQKTIPEPSKPSAAPIPPDGIEDKEQTKEQEKQKEEEKVDMTTFKPVFVPRSERAEPSKKEKDKKDKKKSGKSKGKTIVSFELDEDEGGGLAIKHSKEDRPKKKKKKRREESSAVVREDDDDEMWVEKPPPEVVKSLPPPSFNAHSGDEEDPKGDGGVVSMGPPRGRKRAIDFM